LFVTAPQDIAQTLPAAIQLVKWTVACTRVPFVSFLSRLPNISSVTLFILGGKQVPRFSMLGYYEQTKQQQKRRAFTDDASDGKKPWQTKRQ
jgi:hypothetical protein